MAQRLLDKLSDFDRVSGGRAAKIRGWSTVETANAKKNVEQEIPKLIDDVLTDLPAIVDFAQRARNTAVDEKNEVIALKRKLEQYENDF